MYVENNSKNYNIFLPNLKKVQLILHNMIDISFIIIHQFYTVLIVNLLKCKKIF